MVFLCNQGPEPRGIVNARAMVMKMVMREQITLMHMPQYIVPVKLE